MAALDVYTTKSAEWSYEQEWRVIHKNAGTNYTYASEALVGIYFGIEINQFSLEIVCLIIQGQNENVKEFEYINCILAKKRGLFT